MFKLPCFFYIMGPLTPVIGTTKIAPPGFSTDEWHTRGDSGRPTPTRIACLPYWASCSLSDVTLIVTSLDELFLFLAAGMTGGLDLGVMRNFEGIFIFLVEGIKTLDFSSALGFSGPLSRPGAEITSSSELESSPEAGS